jgi:triosephosphate isomerase
VGRQTLIIGNWKMNLTIHEASVYVHKLDGAIKSHRNVEVVIAPGFLALPTLSTQVDHKKIKLAAQNFYWRDEGTFTGEVSAHQLRGLVQYVLVGHSERRHIFKETNADIRAKVQAAVRNHLTPVLCVGETAQEKADKETSHVLHDQLVSGLANLTSEEVSKIVIAYEPVWAISSGKNFANHAAPTPEIIANAVRMIRRQIKHLYGDQAAQDVRVIYGGSTNSANTASILSAADVDGLLPGGASLQLNEFTSIIEIAHKREGFKG